MNNTDLIITGITADGFAILDKYTGQPCIRITAEALDRLQDNAAQHQWREPIKFVEPHPSTL